MCAILGVHSFGKINKQHIKDANRAIKILKHRGPDYQGIYTASNFIMAHGKLAIQSNDALSNQPVELDNVVVAFNGEIYNYIELINTYKIEGANFDGDVIAFLYKEFGMDFLSLIEGDFAISIYDKRLEKLYLVRDRLGVKQLVYTMKNGEFYFASEVKALEAFTEVRLDPNKDKIFEDLTMWFWSDKRETYFQGVFHLQPGEYLEISDGSVKHHKYWDVSLGNESLPSINPLEMIQKSVKSRLVGNYPAMTLLSGGLDSSLLTVLVSKLLTKVKSITVNYDDFDNNIDRKFADLVVKSNSSIVQITNHIKSSDVNKSRLDSLSKQMEEVIWDKVYFAMQANYQLAKRNGYRVVINGQGADETWLGYYHDFPMYKFTESKDFEVNNLMSVLADTNIGGVKNLSKQGIDTLRDGVLKVYHNDLPSKKDDVLNSVAYWATKTYLQSNLMQEDRLSMMSSVECRTPFTNHKLVELAFSLSGNAKVVNSVEKKPLKEAAMGVLPIELIDRQKQAFVNPEDSYGDLVINDWTTIVNEFLYKNGFSKYFSEEYIASIVRGNISNSLKWKFAAVNSFLHVYENQGDKIHE